MHSRKFFIAGLALTTLLIFAGCTETGPADNNPPASGTKQVPNIEQQTGPSQQATNSSQEQIQGKLSQQLAPINPVSPYSTADQAAYSSAMQLYDLTFCDKISDTTYKKQCQTDVTDNKVMNEALAKNDATVCDKMINEDDKKACQIKVEAQMKLQNQASQQQIQADQEQQLMTQIVQSGDYTRCKELTIENDKTDCELNILVNKAITSKSVTWCDKTSTAETKQRCVDAYNEAAAKPQT